MKILRWRGYQRCRETLIIKEKEILKWSIYQGFVVTLKKISVSKKYFKGTRVFLLKLYFIFLLIVMMIIIKTQGIILLGKF